MARLRSRMARKRQKVRHGRILRNKVRHHHHRRYAGVRGKAKQEARRKAVARRRHVRPNLTPTAKRKQYRVKPKSGQGLPPIPMSTYMSMF